MTRFIVEFNKEGCIGAGACEAACPKFWKLDGDKATLIEGVANNDGSIQTREIGQEDLRSNLDAAQSCPVNVIHIRNKKTGEKLI